MIFVILEFSNINLSLFPGKSAVTLHLVFDETTDISITTSICHFALTMSHTIFIETEIHISQFPSESSVAMLFAINELTYKHVTVWISSCSGTVRYIIYPLAFVHLSIAPPVYTFTIPFIIKGIATEVVSGKFTSKPIFALSLKLSFHVFLSIPRFMWYFTKDQNLFRRVK